MNREIKFRAWNGSEFVKDYYNHNHFISIKDGKLIQVEHDDICDEGIVYRKPESVQLQQFTGLKDADGADIYEGDYVSIFARDDNQYMMCGVVKFGFRGYPGFDIYTRGGNTYADEYNTFTNDDDLYFKVVGNIYQNPEITNYLVGSE